MAEAVKGTRRAYSLGSTILYVQPLTAVMDGSTHASALNNVVGYWANTTCEATVSVKAGCDVGVSAGTFTFRNPDVTYGKNLDLYILTSELE
jgi:hypothetical protein